MILGNHTTRFFFFFNKPSPGVLVFFFYQKTKRLPKTRYENKNEIQLGKNVRKTTLENKIYKNHIIFPPPKQIQLKTNKIPPQTRL